MFFSNKHWTQHNALPPKFYYLDSIDKEARFVLTQYEAM